MARVPFSSYRWRISWKTIVTLFASGAGVYAYGYSLLTRSGSLLGDLVLLVICLSVLCVCLKIAWQKRRPFVFRVRGDRAVQFTPQGRNGIVFSENGRKMVVYAGMGPPPVQKVIKVASIRQWEPPHEDEPLTPQQREEIVDMLCEHYEFEGTPYTLHMNNTLGVTLLCPLCEEVLQFDQPFYFGPLHETRYHIGDGIEWRPYKPAYQGGRHAEGEVDYRFQKVCPYCRSPFSVLVQVRADRIESVEAQKTQNSWLSAANVPS